MEGQINIKLSPGGLAGDSGGGWDAGERPWRTLDAREDLARSKVGGRGAGIGIGTAIYQE